MKRYCVTVLIMEVVVIWLAIPVALTVEHVSARSGGIVGGVALAAAVILAAVAGWHIRWTLVGGSVLQLLVIAAGVVIPVMYVLGVIFAGFWVLGIRLGRRADQVQQARQAGEAQKAPHG
jgi:Protein of unknown function (DUF4233)